MDWRDIPIFIINRNRLDAMRTLIAWLLRSGSRRIVIIDNNSNYPPLLRYYEALPEGVKYIWRERTQGEVRRQINLPERLSHDGIEAKLEDGVLRVKLMKAPESTPKKITVATTPSLNA